MQKIDGKATFWFLSNLQVNTTMSRFHRLSQSTWAITFISVISVYVLLAVFDSHPLLARQSQDQQEGWQSFAREHATSPRPVAKFDPNSNTVLKARRFLWRSNNAQRNAETTARSFLETNSPWLGFDAKSLDIRLVRDRDHRGTRFVRFHQFWNGLEIVDARLHVGVQKEGVTTFSGNVFNSSFVVGLFTIDEFRAVELAKDELGVDNPTKIDVVRKYLPRTAELFLEAIYDVRISDHVVRLSAESGETIYSFPMAYGGYHTAVVENRGIDNPSEEDRMVACTTSASGKAYTSNPSNPNNDTTGVSVNLDRLCSNTELNGKYVAVYNFKTSEGIVPDDGSNTFLYPPDPDPENTSCSLENSSSFEFDNHDCSYFDAVNVYYHIDEIAYYMDNTIGVTSLDTTYKLDAITHKESKTSGASAFFGTGVSDPYLEFAHRHADLSGGIYYDAAKFEDIIFHEYGHILAYATSLLEGDNGTKGQLHEGFADFFSAAFADDAELAEKYVRCPVAHLNPTPINGGADSDHLRDASVSASTWNASDLNSTSLRYNSCEYQYRKTTNPDTFDKSDIWVGAKEDNIYAGGMVWAATLWDLRNKGTRQDAIQLIVDALEGSSGTPSTLEDAAEWIIDAKDASPTSYSSITMSEIIESFVDREIFPDIDYDYEIPSGSTVTYDGGTLEFATDVQITVDGTLTADNFIFQGQGSGTWDGFYVEGTLNLDGSTINDVSVATGTGSIDCSGCTLDLINTDITVPASTNNYGITSTGSVTIDGGEIRSDDYAAIKTTGSSSTLSSKNAEIVSDNDDYVFNAQTSSDVSLYPQGDGGNTFKGLGLNAEGGSTIDAGNDIAGVGEQHFCRQTGTVKLRASGTGSEIYGEYSYYPSGNDPTEVALSGGTIYYSGNEGSSTCSFPKRGEFSQQLADEDAHISLPQIIRRLVRSGDTQGVIARLQNGERNLNAIELAALMSELRFGFKTIENSVFRQSLKQLSNNYSSVGYPRDLLLAQFALIEGSKSEAAARFINLADSHHGPTVRYQAILELALLSLRNGDLDDAVYFANQLSPGSAAETENKLSILQSIERGKRSVSQIGTRGSSPLKQRFEELTKSTVEGVQGLSVYPNPFNPQTVIQFNLAEEGAVTVEIVDVLGRTVQMLNDGRLRSGQHSIRFSIENRASGLYFVRIGTKNGVQAVPIVYLK